ncbi:MAG: DeoR/GlpR transcriptional regulator [Ilumatobacter sp.]|nr:DeoR/GlpR transcriptional regulator [Ilumatobacter sp.]
MALSTDRIDGAPPLFQSERQRQIAALTAQQGRVEVADLAERFGVTTETVRRDLSELQEHRLVRRVHGGAVPWENTGFEPLLAVRNDQQDGEKRRLAQRAIEELPDTGAVIIDSGSTLLRLAAAVPQTCELRIVTNSLEIAQVLADHDSGEVIVIGGKVRKNTLAMVDAVAVAAVEPMHVDTLFISCDGMSAETGLTTPYREEAELKQAMIRSARRVVALADHTKAGHDHFIRFARWSDIDVLVTNTEVDPGFVRAIESAGTTVLLA